MTSMLFGSVAAVLLLCGGVLAFTPREGCLPQLARWAAVILSVVVPLYLMRPEKPSLISVLPLALGAVVLSFAVTMATAAWSSLFSVVKTSADTDNEVSQRIDLSLFNPFESGSDLFSSNTTRNSSDTLDSFLFMIALIVFGALFWVGLQIALLVIRLLPRPVGLGRMVGAVVTLALMLAATGGTMAIMSTVAAAPDTQAVALNDQPAGDSINVTPAPTAVEQPLLPDLYPVHLRTDLNAAWDAVQKPETWLGWQMRVTPPFPEAWPPTASSDWVVYVYATAQEEGLADGVRVAKVWALLRLSEGGKSGTVETLSDALEPSGIQGVFPLPPVQRAILNVRDQVIEIMLSLKALPTEAQAAVTQLYYRTWLQANGATLEDLPTNEVQSAFIEWAQTE